MTFIATMVRPASWRRTMDRSYVRPYFRCMLSRSSVPARARQRQIGIKTA